VEHPKIEPPVEQAILKKKGDETNNTGEKLGKYRVKSGETEEPGLRKVSRGTGKHETIQTGGEELMHPVGRRRSR